MKIAIAGFGMEGRENLEYFRQKFPEAEFTIFDENENLAVAPDSAKNNTVIASGRASSRKDSRENSAKFILGKNAFAKIQNFDLILRSPSIPPRKIPDFAKLHTEKINLGDGISRTKIWSATNEFFAQIARKNREINSTNQKKSGESSIKIIGVTGTKGKGTTSTMIAEILRENYKISSRKVFLVGNIGVPALKILPEIHVGDFVVFEMSSFQLWDLEFSPDAAVVLRIEPDHLNVHESFADYVSAKSHIAKFQTPENAVIFYEDNRFSREIAETSRGQKIPYPAEISLDFDLQVPGEHNRENAKAAKAAARFLGISDEIIEKGLKNFRGLPHRLEFVREIFPPENREDSLVEHKNCSSVAERNSQKPGIKFYDDNYSSAPGATIAAVRAFDVPEVLILGGIDKGADYDELMEVLSEKFGAGKIRKIILIGEVREKLARILAKNGIENYQLLDLANPENPEKNLKRFIENSRQIMQKIVLAARNFALPGDVVIMSPAHASFDMFKNFTDRGRLFRAEVEKLLGEFREKLASNPAKI